MDKVFGILFILTGFFAILGGLYTWGDGSIFQQTELMKVLIPWADVLLTGPLSLICGYGILKKKVLGPLIGSFYKWRLCFWIITGIYQYILEQRLLHLLNRSCYVRMFHWGGIYLPHSNKSR
jgi:hypothetical protein